MASSLPVSSPLSAQSLELTSVVDNKVTVKKDGTVELPNGKTYKITNLTIDGQLVSPLPGILDDRQIGAINDLINSIFSQVQESDLRDTDIQAIKLTTSSSPSSQNAEFQTTSSNNTILKNKKFAVDTQSQTTTIKRVFESSVAHTSGASSSARLSGSQARTTSASTGLTQPPATDRHEPPGRSTRVSHQVSGVTLTAASVAPATASTANPARDASSASTFSSRSQQAPTAPPTATARRPAPPTRSPPGRPGTASSTRPPTARTLVSTSTQRQAATQTTLPSPTSSAAPAKPASSASAASPSSRPPQQAVATPRANPSQTPNPAASPAAAVAANAAAPAATPNPVAAAASLRSIASFEMEGPPNAGVQVTSNQPTAPPGSLIEYSYKIGDKEYGKQTITRSDTLNDARLFLENTISHLQNKLAEVSTRIGKPETTSAERAELRGEQTKIKEELRLYRSELESLNQISSKPEDIEADKQALQDLKTKLGAAQSQLSTAADKEIIKSAIERLEAEIQTLTDKIDQNKTWLNSDYFRDLLKTTDNFEDAIKKYIAVPINMRQQVFKVGTEEVSVCRLGVISDMRNGWYSLTDLKNLQESIENGESVEAGVNSLATTIYKNIGLSDAIISNLMSPDKATRDKGALKLEAALKKLAPKQRQSVEFALSNLDKLKKPGINKDASIALLQEAITDRRRVLEQQMIHVIVHQAKNNPELLKKALEGGESFDMVHVGLLNPKSVSLDKTGWMHDERVEIEDMREIFKEFRGKKLVLDGTGPLIDGNTIHLPRIPGVNTSDKEVTINPYFLNVSVQGHMENDGVQAEMNKQEMGELFAKNMSIFSTPESLKIAQQLESGDPKAIPKSDRGYPMAEDLLAALSKKSSNLAVSYGCLSAKDRTGFIGARIMQRQLQPALVKDGVKYDHFEGAEFSLAGPAAQVVKDNTHALGLKVNPKANLRTGTATKVSLVAKAGLAVISTHAYNLFNK